MNSSKYTIAIVTTLGLMTGISPANAQNGDNNFAGPKVGVQAGWERRKIDENVLPAPNSTRLNDKSNGISYGGFVGYDAQFDKFVLGVEADFNPNGKTLNSTVAGGRTVELDSKWAASASARAGIALTPNLLAYGRLGYGFNRHTTRLLTTGNTTPVATNKVTSGSASRCRTKGEVMYCSESAFVEPDVATAFGLSVIVSLSLFFLPLSTTFLRKGSLVRSFLLFLGVFVVAKVPASVIETCFGHAMPFVLGI